MPLNEMLNQDLDLRLGQVLDQSPPAMDLPGLIPAAVLILIFRHEGQWQVLFTRRSGTVSTHQGQIAFPGGRIDIEHENARVAALREAREEIGLATRHVSILGSLPAYPTVTGYNILPFVATIPWPCPLQANPDEVTRLFSIPIHWLLDGKHQQEKSGRYPDINKPIKYAAFTPYSGEIIWGATARITIELLTRIRQSAAARE